MDKKPVPEPLDKKPVPESLIDKVAGFQYATLLKKRP